MFRSELFDELRQKGFDVHLGIMGENVSTVDEFTFSKFLVAGNNPDADILGSSEVGMKAAWVSRGRKWVIDDCNSEVVVESVSELVGMIFT